jgi:hypothetical protein
MSSLKEDSIGSRSAQSRGRRRKPTWLRWTNDESMLLMMTCGLHNVDPEAEALKQRWRRLQNREPKQSIDLDNPRTLVHHGQVGGEAEQRWYLK